MLRAFGLDALCSPLPLRVKAGDDGGQDNRQKMSPLKFECVIFFIFRVSICSRRIAYLLIVYAILWRNINGMQVLSVFYGHKITNDKIHDIFVAR